MDSAIVSRRDVILEYLFHTVSVNPVVPYNILALEYGSERTLILEFGESYFPLAVESAVRSLDYVTPWLTRGESLPTAGRYKEGPRQPCILTTLADMTLWNKEIDPSGERIWRNFVQVGSLDCIHGHHSYNL
uniref:Uncharacterized protein n=1 Tax=Timema tahoe TaxID=61484 RepID=A0A7R9P059_9NEOP|nr:unnamed protein product [Timema tahoe]